MSARELKNRVKATLFKMSHSGKQPYHCVVCGYRGPFRDKIAKKEVRSRRSCKCPRCSSMERHRFQWFLLERVLAGRTRSELSMLHFAPEPCIENLCRAAFGRYVTADLFRESVDYQFDVQDIPFEDGAFDVILISHVLQYVPDDRRGIRELHRILKPGGVAFMPVPLFHEQTREPEVLDPILKMPHEPGLDYFERYGETFPRVELHKSMDYDDEHHFFREAIVARDLPLDLGNGRYGDIIPVCYKD